MKPVRVPLTALREWSPFRSVCWGDILTPITRHEVDRAIEAGKLLSPAVVYDETRPTILPGNISIRQFHIRRIAYFVVHKWTKPLDPIEIDVGVPDLGCYVDWPVIDGNHRHAAAILRGDTHIQARISGSLDYAEELLGVRVRA